MVLFSGFGFTFGGGGIFFPGGGRMGKLLAGGGGTPPIRKNTGMRIVCLQTYRNIRVL